MKVIFLDLDGVLNSTNYFIKVHERVARGEVPNESTHRGYASAMLDQDAVELLNQIVRETGAVIVVSSTWRLSRSLVTIDQMLRYRGFGGYLIGTTLECDNYKTPAFEKFLKENPGHVDGTRRCRGNEIQNWLDAVPAVKTFAILDDDSDMAHLLPFLVKTLGQSGLQPEHVVQAVKLLNHGV